MGFGFFEIVAVCNYSAGNGPRFFIWGLSTMIFTMAKLGRIHLLALLIFY
jgi:hypothetical protein